MLVDPALVVPLSLLGALGLACVGLLIRLGLRYGSVDESVVVGFISSCVLLVPLALIAAWPPGGTPLALGLYATDGVVSAVAVTLQYTAVGLVGPSIAYAIKSTAPLTAVIVRLGPSTSVSFATSAVTGSCSAVSSGVLAESAFATGASLTGATLTVTWPVSVAEPSETV